VAAWRKVLVVPLTATVRSMLEISAAPASLEGTRQRSIHVGSV
jgi:hypothetical protein